MEFREILVVCITAVVIFASGIGGCTVTVMNSNAQYYATMKQCIDVGATFEDRQGSKEKGAGISRSPPLKSQPARSTGPAWMVMSKSRPSRRT